MATCSCGVRSSSFAEEMMKIEYILVKMLYKKEVLTNLIFLNAGEDLSLLI
jgi:hypothetical protein